MKQGLLAEFDSADKLLAAIARARADGYRRLDAFLPFPIEAVEDALELPRSPVRVVVLIGGITGATLAYLIQWWCSAVDYPLNVGGYPPHSIPSFIPITFETTVLLAALSAFIAVFAFCGLPRLWNPLFEVDGFERASIDRYFLAVDARDVRFDADRTKKELEAGAPLRVVRVP
jgi:hypothetical protein